MPLVSRAHRRFCELLPQEQRSVEESLRVRVSFEQILSLPELKVRVPHPFLRLTSLDIRGLLAPILRALSI